MPPKHGCCCCCSIVVAAVALVRSSSSWCCFDQVWAQFVLGSDRDLISLTLRHRPPTQASFKMRAFALSALLLSLLLIGGAEAQLFRNFLRNIGRGVNTVIRPVMDMFHSGPSRPAFFSSGGVRPSRPSKDSSGGTLKPVATGHDNPFPDDCGRDPKKGTGLLCFPDGKLCQESKSLTPGANAIFYNLGKNILVPYLFRKFVELHSDRAFRSSDKVKDPENCLLCMITFSCNDRYVAL